MRWQGAELGRSPSTSFLVDELRRLLAVDFCRSDEYPTVGRVRRMLDLQRALEMVYTWIDEGMA